jgi:hypothetical protein
MLMLAALGGCHAGHDSSQLSGPSSNSSAVADLRDLRLEPGFYVASDVDCDKASNATLALLHRHGLNSSREDCAFAKVEGLGENRYRITEQCMAIGTGEVSQYVAQWEVLSSQGFRRTLDSGWVAQMRHCDQQALPEGWRDIDLDAAIERRPPGP